MKRLLAIILASLLILSSATAGASAYQAYKDDALTKYDFTDTAVLTTEQYASALLDYADKALAKENITMDLSILGKLDATSIDNALSSVYKLINGNKIILWMAGDLNSVNVDAIKNPRRSNTTDVAVIKALLQFLADNKGIVKKVVVGGVGKYKRDGGVSLGVANSFVKVDLNVEVMLREMIWGLAYPNTEYNSSNNIDSMLQVIIQNALAGVKEIPDSVRNLVDLNSTKSTYDFIEDLLQTAYNDIAVPMLNDQTMKWLGQEIDKDTTGTLAGLFNRDFRVSAYTVPAGSTLVAELNNIAGGIVNGLLKNYNGWVSGDNSKLTDNVVAVARYILKETGDYFFPDWQKHIATAEEIDAMSKEELIAYLARSIINASVGYMYIPEDVTTVIGVAWEAVKQLMAQFLPERDYSGYPKTVQGILNMLADFVAYNVNPGIDLNAGDLKKALNYGDGMDKMLTTAVQWLAADPQYYTGLLPSTTIDTSDGWKALDDIFFKLLDKSVLPAKFANSGSETILKDIVYSILNGLLVDQDLTCISDLFVKNESGAFATQTLKQSIVRLVTDILNAVLPGTITKTYGSLNEIVSNSELGSIVENLLGSLNSNKDKLVPPIVNIVAQVMKLTDKAKFKEMEIAGSKRIKNSSELDLTVYNGSQGINRGYTDKNNNFTQDKLPRYTIDSWSAVAYNYDGSKQKDLSVSGLTANEELNGGDNRSVKISGIDSNNTLVVFTVYYFALDEAGNKLTNDASVCRFYSYRLDGADVDNNTSGINTGSNKTSASVNDCPPKLLLFNQNNTNPLKTICAQSVTFKVPKGKGAHTGSNASANLGGLSSNLKSATSSASMDGGNAISGSNAYDSIDLWEETASIAKFEVGFDTTINWAATAKKGNKTDHYNGATRIICYNDYGLPELYNIEAGKNRARTDYDSSADAAWDAYITALNNAAIYTLLPGTIALYTNSEFLAGFEARQKALASAVETLETHLVSASVDSLKTAVEAVQGKDNAEGAVYWDDGYNYFGYDDFNSVTWNGWKEARNRALNLYNSTIAPKEPVAPEKPGDDATLIEKQKYEKAYAQWETDHAAWETAIVAWQTPTISAIDVAYAEQQVELWGSRLIKLAAVKTHLDAAIKMCTIDSADASKYDADRWEAYAKSFAYAQKVSTSFNASTTMRTQVREAMNNLIYNWKRLIANPVVTVTFTFTVNGETHAVLTGNQGDPVDLSSIEAPAAPVGMHFVGWGNVPATFDADATFEAQFANNTDTKYTVNVYNMDTTGNYPATPDSTYQGAGETNSTADITADAVAAEGFSLDSAKSTLTGTIAADGSLVLKVYYSRNQYKLTVDGNVTNVYYGAAISVSEPAAREGYTFAGWDRDVPETMPASDVTLVSQWNENDADYTAYNAAKAAAEAKQAEANFDKTYTAESRQALADALAKDVSGRKYTQQGEVDAAAKAINDAVTALELMTYKATFYVDGAEYKVVTAKVGEAIAKPDDPSKTGYVFTGWDPEVGTMGTEDLTFNAKFSAGEVSYTVETYVMGLDGQYGAADSKNVAATTGAEITLTPDAREGFTVAGESVLTGTVAADSSLVLKVYYSRNQYKLTVDGTTTEVYYGAALEIADPEARTGYTFAGWKPAAPATMPANDVTLESQWTENDADYTAYDAAVKAAQAKQAESDYAARYTEESRNALAAALAADVSGKKYTQQGEVDAATTAINNAVAGLDKMTYNAIFTVDGEEYAKVPTKVDDQIVAPKDPSKEGYTFAGWKPSVGIMGTADATFEAVFAAAGDTAYTVNTYVMGTDGTYGDPASEKLTGTTGSTATYAPEAREGFTVADESVLSGTIAADGNLVLKVYYSRNKYTLTVDGVASEVYYGAAVSVAEPSKEHYTFAGWEPELPDTMPANDVTVVSKWTEDGADYTAYDAAVAAAQAKKAETDYDKTYTAESRAALDAALAEKVSGKKYSEQNVVDAATKAINDAIAALDLMTYNATFYVDGAEYRVVPTKVGAQIVAPEAPSKTGYVFTGWDPAVGVMGTEDVSFNAQFSAGEVSYKVETYVMGLDGQYGAAETKTVPATTGAAVSVEPEAREGFTVADNSVLSGVVVADSSLVLKVYYSRNQYKLSVDGVESDVYYGAALNIAAPAAREGFTFTGWNVEVPANMPASDLTLVSQWSENDADYTAYNAAVAAAKAKQGEENYDKMYTAETRDALAGALAIDVAGKKYSEQSVVDAATKAINDAVAALEVMTYNAIFTVDGAQYEVVPTKVGEQIVAPKDPAKEGYVFKGWDKEVGKMGVEDITFAAQFEEASGIAYTVEVYTMDVNGNYGAAETKTLYGTTGAQVTADTTAAEGFTFDESAANVVSGTVAADGSLVLKVYFARNQYKLTVDGAESEVYYGAALDIATPAAREGYTFIGWNVDVPANMPASDLTLVSQWSENDADYTAYNAAVAAAQAKKAETDYDKTYTAESRAALDAALAEKVSGKKYSEQNVVDAATKAINDAIAALDLMTYNATFYVDGAEYRVVPTKVGEQIIAPENPAKEGFVFTGWDKEVGVMGTEDVSFNAQFSAGEVSYKVETYVMDVNGAYGAADVKVVPATTGAAVSVDPEAREGFTVAADSVLSGTVAADSSLVLKVYYSRNQYKLTVDGAESMVYYGAELNIAEPTKDHYTFAGWNVEVPATMPASDLTLVSQWTEEGADYTAYDAAVKAAQAKKAEADYDKTYTAESRAALDAALAIDVANKKYSEQADVDAATAAINDAVKALELMTYTANFYVNGQLYKAVTAKVGEQIIAPKDPSVDGYNFNGWDPAVGTMGTEDVRFDAILVASNSSIISVTPETPNYGGMHQYAVKVKGEPLKIKIVDANGNTRTFDRNTSMTSDANALGILKIEKTEDGEIWLINANLAEGKFTAYAKMAKEYWENDGYGFTVSFDQKPEPKIGDVTEVTYDTPNYGGKQDYRVKVTDKAGKIQFVYANGGTTTLTRLDPRVSIKSYDAQGNEVYANSTNLAYEIWTVNFNLPAGNYVVRAKYGRNTWSEGLAVNVVISAKPATAVSVTEVNTSADSVAVTVNGTAKKVKITYASGATRTFNRDDANVSIASNGDGEIWTINVKLTEGDYTATAKYIDNGKQVWDTTDFAFTV